MTSSSNSKSYSAPKDVVFNEAFNAVNALGLKIERRDEPNGMIEAKVGASFLTWGHHIKISITPSQQGSSVYVESRVKGQLLDYGKNRENVDRIFAELDRRVLSLGYAHVPASPPSPSPPPAPGAQKCPTCGQPLTFIQQYGRWYCYTCKKYP